jgi:hypothetical protein
MKRLWNSGEGKKINDSTQLEGARDAYMHRILVFDTDVSFEIILQ